MDAWVAAYRHELDREGVDPDGLLEETVRRADQSRAAAWRLFDALPRPRRGDRGGGPWVRV